MSNPVQIGDATLHFRVGHTADAQELVEKFHYSGRWPSNVQVVGTWHEPGGLFGDFGPAIAACVFSIPPTRWSEPCWELSRLVRREDVHPALTGLIAKTVNFVKQLHKIDLLVSFADWTHDHHGGVYQAASWKFAGKRERRMDGVVLGGQLVPGRSANSRWGTRSPTKLAEIGVEVEAHFDEGKYLYWRPLARDGLRKANRLGLQSLPYPKPDMFIERPKAAEQMDMLR